MLGTTNATNVIGNGTLIFDTTVGPSPGPINVTTVNGNGLQVSSGSILVPFLGLNVQTQGGHAFLANGAGASITVTNGASINSTGVGAALAAIGGTINATGVTMTATAGSNGHGAIAESGGTINLHAGTSIVRGGGFNAVGIGASGAGSTVNATALIPVTMQGRGAMGIYLHNGGQVFLQPGQVLNLEANSSVGVAVDDTTLGLGALDNLTINLNGAGVVGQAGSTGLVAFGNSTVAVQNLTVQGQNAAAGVWARPGTSITISSNSVIDINSAQNQTYYTLLTSNLVTPSGSIGSSFGSTGGTPQAGLKSDEASIFSIGTTINVTSGNGAAGVNTSFGGMVDMTNNTITTSGTNSFGVRVDSGEVIGRNSSITTSGGGAALFFNFGPGLIDLTNTTVLATGAGTTGLASLNGTAAGMNEVRLSGGSLVSTEQTAILALGPLNVTTSNGAVVTGGGGFLLEALDNTGLPQATVVQLDALSGSVLTGDAMAESLSVANINLMTGSRWTGAAFDVTNVLVDATSTWSVTESSTVTQQVTNAGLIHFIPPSGPFRTLTTQNYVGTGGTLGLYTFLGTDGSPSDLLVIDGGTASGTSFLQITNAGGPGAQTTGDGILVVDAINGATTVTGAFQLAGVVAAGAFQYDLFRGGVTDPDDWFLRSTGIRPDVPVHASVPPIGSQYGFAMLGTLHERVGDPFWGGPLSKARVALAYAAANSANATYAENGRWARIIGETGRNRTSDFFRAGSSTDWEIGAIQAGFDVRRRETPEGMKEHAGFYFGLGAADAKVAHLTPLGAGKIELAGYTIGGYWTRFSESGGYLDAVAQGTFYGAKASTAATRLNAKGFGGIASLEAGRPYMLNDKWILEPQAQIAFQRVDFGSISDPTASIALKPTNTLLGRIGARLVYLKDAESAFWLRGNIWHEFIGRTSVTFAGPDGSNAMSFVTPFNGTWGEIGLGASFTINKESLLFANGAYRRAIDGRDQYAWHGKAGVTTRW